MVIIGGGAAGYAAAEMLRREGYAGGVTIVSDDAAAPYDRPNLSKDYLAGTAPEEWIPLRPPEFYVENGIDLRLGTTATALDVAGRRVMLSGGEALGFDKLLLATGAEPIRLQVPGADLPHVRTLRSVADSRDLVARARRGSHAVVVGASFIGLEAAAALRHRDVEVHVVAPEARPMEHVLGPELGDFVRQLHERHNVVFHLGHTVWNRRIVLVAASSGEGLLTERRTAAQPWRRELAFMPTAISGALSSPIVPPDFGTTDDALSATAYTSHTIRRMPACWATLW
jgi:NADPH-dependent 2,4-dienoyl-CoA reductase/sulfur reductase-like enzyme